MYQFGLTDVALDQLESTTHELAHWRPEENERIKLGIRLLREICGPDGERDDYLCFELPYLVPSGQGHEEVVLFITSVGWWIYALARWNNNVWRFKVSAFQPYVGSWEAAYHDYPWSTWEEISKEWHICDSQDSPWVLRRTKRKDKQ